MLINGLRIRIIHATTEEIIRELILNPSVDYQSRGVRKPPTEVELGVRSVAYVLRPHRSTTYTSASSTATPVS
jgi:hypothetical protein